MFYARYVSQLQQRGSPAFLAWLDQYVVDSFSGILPVDQVGLYGFPIPGRPADALWYLPNSDEEARTSPLDSIQTEWWQEDADDFVLGLKQQSDDVQSCDHFTWFRIPLADIVQLMRT